MDNVRPIEIIIINKPGEPDTYNPMGCTRADRAFKDSQEGSSKEYLPSAVPLPGLSNGFSLSQV